MFHAAFPPCILTHSNGLTSGILTTISITTLECIKYSEDALKPL